MKMGSFFKAFWQELRSALRDGLLLLCALALALGGVLAVRPLAQAYLEGRQDTGILQVALVDEEDSFYTRLVLSGIESAPSVAEGLVLIPASRTEAEALLTEHAVCAAVIVPAGFVESVQSGQFRPLEVVLNDALPFGASIVEEAVHSGVYLMSAVQNSLYGVYQGLAELGLEQAELERQFNREMLVLIGEALNRNAVFTSETLSPWRGGIFAHYMSSVLLLFLCALSLYHLYRRGQAARSALSSRMRALGWPYALLAGADLAASSALLTLFGGTLALVIAGLCGASTENSAVALCLVSAFALYVCAMSHAVMQLSWEQGAAALIMGVHLVGMVLAGALIPHIYLFAGGAPQLLSDVLPHAVWHRALTRLFTGQSLPPHLYAVCFLHVAVMVVIAMKVGHRREEGGL